MPKGSEPAPAPLNSDAVAVVGSATPAEANGPKNYAHTLSLRLTAEQYRRLRRYVVRMEDEGHGRVTHQSVIETALGEYLERQGK